MKRPGLILIVAAAASACGGAREAERGLRDAGKKVPGLPSGGTLNGLEGLFQPKKSDQTDTAGVPVSGAPHRPAGADQQQENTLVLRTYDSECRWGFIGESDMGSYWTRDHWIGACTWIHGTSGGTIRLPPLVDLWNVSLPDEDAATIHVAPVFAPLNNELVVLRGASSFNVVLNDPETPVALGVEWRPDQDAFNPDQGHCGNTTFYHRNDTQSFAFTLDAEAMRRAVAPVSAGGGEDVFAFKLEDPATSGFARLALELRTTAPGAPAFSTCQDFGPAPRVRWHGTKGTVRVYVRTGPSGSVHSVMFKSPEMTSDNGYAPFKLFRAPVLGIDDAGASEVRTGPDAVVVP